MYQENFDPTKGSVSFYQPSEGVRNLTAQVLDAYDKGYTILNRSWEEMNHYSIIDRENKDQRTFNAFVDEGVEDPAEGWKWKGTRSMARDKAIDMHAHMTAVLAVPMAFAQNEKQQEDVAMSNVMRDVLEWMVTAPGSEYPESYTNIMMGVLYSPAKWMGAEWVEAYTTIKEKLENGELVTREVLDESLSGFRSPIYSVDQVLISNVFEQNVQRQYIVIKRQNKSYHDVERRWSWHDNWEYVRPGIKVIYGGDGLFYETHDEQHASLVEEVTAWCRKTDTEVTFLNGIYMGEPAVDSGNMIRHRDNFNLPKVPLVPFGYERINEHFFYWKSLMNRVGWDNTLLDAMYENTMNREAIDLIPPMAMYGVEEFSSSVVFPGAVVSFENPDAKAEAMIPRNIGAGYDAMEKIEKSIREKTTSETMSGELPAASQKAYNVQRAEQNARTIMKGMLRSVAFSVMKYGDLMKDIAIQHLTTAQWDEITGAESYRTLILRNQIVSGKQVNKRLIFDDALVGSRMTKKQAEEASLKMLSEIDFPNNKEHVYKINPHVWSKLKYLIQINPDEMIERNAAFERSMAERMYAMLRTDPLISPEGLVRKLLNANYRGEAEDMMAKKSVIEQPANEEGRSNESRQVIQTSKLPNLESMS